MGNDDFELPNMDDLAKQMEEATAQVEEAMKGLEQLGSIGDVMGSIASVTDDLPNDLDDLTSALGDFGEQHEANVQSATPEPDWALEARLEVGGKLDVIVSAVLSVEGVRQAWSSTQGAGFESLVGSTITDAGVEVEAGEMGQIMEQLRQGRSMARVEGVEVLAVRIQGAPADARESLRLSPEAHIPLAVDERGLRLEFAPLLTIRNKWENADVPTFSPMAEEIVVPLESFDEGDAFEIGFEVEDQDDSITVGLVFQPLD